MLKNILIILVFILLLATASNVTSVVGQSHEKKGPEAGQTNTDDYHRTANERFVVEALNGLFM